MTGRVTKNNVIFVEDEFAKDWVEDALRQYASSKIAAIEVHAAGGFPFVTEVTRHHNLNPAVKSKAIAIVDGDSPVPNPAPDYVFKLPGEVPENVIWRYIDDHVDDLVGLIQQRCLIPQMAQDEISKHVKQVTVDAGDPHLIFKKLAERLGFLSELTVRRAMISIYNERNKEQLEGLIAAFDAIDVN